VALAAFVPPWIFASHSAIPFSLVMEVVWLGLLVVGLIFFRPRSLWLLFEVPVVFFRLFPALLLYGCAWGPYACP
jgi:hypothetical protein